MEDQYLLPHGGKFYKANLHLHTVLSDGNLTPEQVKYSYKREGYSILAFTDHNTYHYSDLTDPDFLVIPGLEVDLNETGKPWPKPKTYHINLLDTNPLVRLEEKKAIGKPASDYYDMDGLNQYIAKMNDLGFLAIYNHPYWSMQTHDDYARLKGLFAMEIYNHGCEIDGLYGSHPQVYDEMLRSGQHIYCFATDDNHNRYPAEHPESDSFGGYVQIKATSLDYASIMKALRAGHFYSSTGPSIEELYLENNTLHIRCSPVEKIYVITENRRSYYRIAKPGTTITEASFPLEGVEGYVRVNCQDNQRLNAYSNAYFLK